MKVKAKKVIHYYTRIKAGEIVDLPEDIVKAFGEEYLTILEEPPKEVLDDVGDSDGSKELFGNNRRKSRRKA
jgi:hypothetical protein